MKVVMKGAPLAIALAISMASMTATAAYPGEDTAVENGFTGDSRGCVIGDGETAGDGSYIGGRQRFGVESGGSAAAGSFACGYGNHATGEGSVAFGLGNGASGEDSIVIGVNNAAGGRRSVALGYGNTSADDGSLTVGYWNNAGGAEATAVGTRTHAQGAGSLAVGAHTISAGTNATAVGTRAEARAENATALGQRASANTAHSVAIGSNADVRPEAAAGIAIGRSATSRADDSVALGQNANTWHSAQRSVAIGNTASTNGAEGVAIGHAADVMVGAVGGVAIGGNANADGVNAIALGQQAKSGGYDSAMNTVAIGTQSYARATDSIAIGRGAGIAIGNEGSLALGSGSYASGSTLADEAFLVGGTAQSEVAFGNSTSSRRLTRVAAGSHALDAVNVSQLQGVASNFINWIGGGAGFTNNQFVAPTFVVQGSSYGNVGDAFAAIDLSLTNINTRIDGLGEGGAGADGRSAYEVAIDNGFTGSEPEWLASLKGDQGERGERGEAGAAGLDGRDGIDGTNGIDGRDGRSAYEVAQDNGYSGSESEWLDSLHGRDGVDGVAGTPGRDGIDGRDGADGAAGRDGLNGIDGANGSSAYEVAVENGFSGSESEWLASLRGETGAAGPQGPEGPAGTGDGTGTDLEEGLAVEYTDETHTAVRLNPQGEGRTRISNVAEGSSEDDAVNVGQMRAQSAQSVRISNDYTDARINQLEATWNDRWDELDGRIGDLDRRVARVGALNAALTMMAGAGTHKEVGQVSAQVGWGQYRSNAAFAVGVHARPTERSSLMIGFSHDGREAMGGVGYSWIID